MTNNPLVSVIIPNYNYGKYLSCCIESVLEQTYSNIEIIVVDDCSTDDSSLIYDKFRDKKNLTILTNPVNSGVVFSRNRGIDNSKGDYIALLDPDDYWLPEKISSQVGVLQSNECEIICTSIKIVDLNDRDITIRHSLFSEISYKNMLKSNSIPHSTALIKSELLAKERYQQVKNPYFGRGIPFVSQNQYLIHEDFALLLRLLRSEKVRVCYLSTPLVVYRKHSSSYSASFIKKILSLYVIFRIQEKFPVVKSFCYTIRLIAFAAIKNAREL